MRRLITAALFMAVGCCHAADTRRTPLPRIYKPQAGACYVQLRPTWPKPPYASGEDQPVCRAVLANLNKFCKQPPQYNRRLLHPTTHDLSEPVWKPLDPKDNLDIVREVFTTTANSPEDRALYWKGNEKQMTALPRNGTLRLSMADFDIDSDGTPETVYLQENIYPTDTNPGTNSPMFMVADQGQRIRSVKGATMGWSSFGDLWRFDSRWYSIHIDFDTHPGPGITVGRVVSDLGHLGAVTDCTIQHTSVYRRT